MRVSDNEGREYLLKQGKVWQFAHINEGSLDNILNARDCLFIVYRVVTCVRGTQTCRFVVKEISLPNRTYDFNALKEELMFVTELQSMEGSELYGLLSGDLVPYLKN